MAKYVAVFDNVMFHILVMAKYLLWLSFLVCEISVLSKYWKYLSQPQLHEDVQRPHFSVN